MFWVNRVFTLIELLITIAIIAVLAGMLLPALKHARDMAKTTACMNNLKGFGVAVASYTNDNHDFFPEKILTGNYNETKATCWDARLSPYLGIRNGEPEMSSTLIWQIKQKRKTPYLCPAGSTDSGNAPSDDETRSYIANPYFGLAGSSGSVCYYEIRKAGMNSSPSRIGILYEGQLSPLFGGRTSGMYLAGISSDPDNNFPWNTSNNKYRFYHNKGSMARSSGTMNLLFLDMHAGNVKLNELRTVTSSGVQYKCQYFFAKGY